MRLHLVWLDARFCRCEQTQNLDGWVVNGDPVDPQYYDQLYIAQVSQVNADVRIGGASPIRLQFSGQSDNLR